MTDCKDCLSNDICCLDDRPRRNCFFFSETEESRIRNSKEYKQGRLDAIDEFVNYVKQYMWWSTQADEKVIGEFALEEYASVFKDKLKEQKNG